ncbi:MAG: class I SAM-dependent methyltransferase [Candidatus Eisenbacteria bacterium]
MSVSVQKPVRGPADPPLFLREVIEAAPRGAHVLDAGCGPGSWPYVLRPDLVITGFDIKFPPGPPPRSERMRVARADLARLPFRDASFDLTVCHYVLEHVTELDACCDELVRVTRAGGVLYLSVPRAASFDDRLYRFAGYFAKYALMKFGKRIEHQQRFDLDGLLGPFERRGLRLAAHAFVPAGFSWMNDPRTKPLQGVFTNALAALHRWTGVDLAKDANFVLTFVREGGSAGGAPAGVRTSLPGLRRVTHVCRDCGEHAIVSAGRPWPVRWECAWCGKPNPFGRPR